MKEQIRKSRNLFAGITIFTVVFSIIYEHFSHGVYSGYMLCAWLIPLVGVVLPYSIYLRFGRLEKGEENPAYSIYQSAVLTLLLGSIFQGILEIYGTTNRLSRVYWVVGGGLLVASGVVGLWRCKRLTVH